MKAWFKSRANQYRITFWLVAMGIGWGVSDNGLIWGLAMVALILVACITFERAITPPTFTLDAGPIDIALRRELEHQARTNGGTIGRDPDFPQILTINTDLWMPSLALALASAAGQQYLGPVKTTDHGAMAANLGPAVALAIADDIEGMYSEQYIQARYDNDGDDHMDFHAFEVTPEGRERLAAVAMEVLLYGPRPPKPQRGRDFPMAVTHGDTVRLGDRTAPVHKSMVFNNEQELAAYIDGHGEEVKF